MSSPAWFDGKLSLGNIITIAVVLAGIVAGWYRFEGRQALAEDRFSRQVAVDAERARRTDQRLDRIEADRDDLKGRMIRIEEKLSGQGDKLDRILRSVETGGRN